MLLSLSPVHLLNYNNNNRVRYPKNQRNHKINVRSTTNPVEAAIWKKSSTTKNNVAKLTEHAAHFQGKSSSSMKMMLVRFLAQFSFIKTRCVEQKIIVRHQPIFS